jgi:hypothetical protein
MNEPTKLFHRELTDALSVSLYKSDTKGHVILGLHEANIYGSAEIASVLLTYTELFKLAAALMDAHRATNNLQLKEG